MATETRLSLEAERLRAEGLWRDFRESYVPLAAAAAIAFHQAQGGTKAIISLADYNDALNIAASALSRLIPVYALKDPRKGKTTVVIDLTRQRFARGATELHGMEVTPLTGLSVRRADLESALSLIRRTGLPFSLAVLPEEKEPETPVEPKAPAKN